MLTITPALKEHMVKSFGLAADASDEAARTLVGQKLAAGELAPDTFAELTKKSDAKDPGTKLAELIGKSVADAVKPLNERLAAIEGSKSNPDPLRAAIDKSTSNADGAKPWEVYAKADNIRVKSAAEQYSTTKSRARYSDRTWAGSKHYLAGLEAVHEGRPLDTQSELDKAIAGAWLKYSFARSCGRFAPGFKMTDHDRDLVQYALHNSRFVGTIGAAEDADLEMNDPRVVNRKRLDDFQIKALLDDSTSGGIEIAPIEFDDLLVTVPVLYGELYPLVNVVPVARGRRMKGGSITNPTMTWGTAEGSAITVFTTTSMVAAFDTTIFPCVGGIEIGSDFLEDSPTNVAQIIQSKYGEKIAETLDYVVANGDGTTQPEGVFTASGTTAIVSQNGTGGPPTVADYEALYFGVSKAYRNEGGARGVYIANDTSYRRARAINVGPYDARRVWGMDQADYKIMGRDYKVQNDIANTKIAYAMLNRYRMYRRLGATFKQIVPGMDRTLTLTNNTLLVVRMRFGGRLEAGAAAAVCSTAQS